MYSRLLFMSLAAVCLVSSCSKTDSMSDIPEISFVSAQPAVVKQYSDTLRLTFAYRDGNGDLGENAPNVFNCFVTDSRNGVEYKFRIKQLAPDADIAIEGNLTVQLTGIPILNNQTSETYTYAIRVVDRAGNESNTIASTSITVTE